MQFLSALSDGLTDVGILGEEAIFILYILNGSALTQFAGVTDPESL